MNKPDDIPEDVWSTAYEAMPPWSKMSESPAGFVLQVGFAKAILAERERCALLAQRFPSKGPTVEIVDHVTSEMKDLAKMIRKEGPYV